jgi:hypothetical protein
MLPCDHILTHRAGGYCVCGGSMAVPAVPAVSSKATCKSLCASSPAAQAIPIPSSSSCPPGEYACTDSRYYSICPLRKVHNAYVSLFAPHCTHCIALTDSRLFQGVHGTLVVINALSLLLHRTLGIEEKTACVLTTSEHETTTSLTRQPDRESI